MFQKKRKKRENSRGVRVGVKHGERHCMDACGKWESVYVDGVDLILVSEGFYAFKTS